MKWHFPARGKWDMSVRAEENGSCSEEGFGQI